MRFWDTSALLPTIVDEPTTDACLSLLSMDPTVLVWEGTLIELLSVVGRLRREAEGLDDLCSSIRLDVQSRWATWARVADWSRVSAPAQRLVSVHPLKAADSLQLAAAIVASEERPHTLPFVTRDRALARAAQLEGFPVIVPASTD